MYNTTDYLLPSTIFTENALEQLSNFLEQKKYSQIWVLTDENTHRDCLPLLNKYLSLPYQEITIQSGEEHKNLQTCTQVWQILTEAETDRKAVMLNLGGGVIGDMGGFCAATYKRGIDFIQIPTTLLSQVDASVGGKLGVDFEGFKNHIGVFCEPQAVVIEPLFLQTLSKAELRSGFAEIIKHCLIADENQWKDLLQNWTPSLWKNLSVTEDNLSNWHQLILHSIHIKHQVVSQDPTEKGLRKILNFGHTVGHAVESYLLEDSKRKCLHGEAIALGMICESEIAYQKQSITLEEKEAIKDYLEGIYDFVPILETELNQIAKLARQDKKNEAGKIQASLLNQIGEANFNQSIEEDEVIASLLYYLKSVKA